MINKTIFKPRRLSKRLKKHILSFDYENKVLYFKPGFHNYENNFVLKVIRDLYTSFKLFVPELERKIKIKDNILIVNGKIESYHIIILESFAKNYLIDVKGSVCVKENLSISFRKVSKSFRCDNNSKITSAKGFPRFVGESFLCYANNNLEIKKEELPEETGNFYFHNNKTRFTQEEILKYCHIKGKIIIIM
jgi:predicted ATPase